MKVGFFIDHSSMKFGGIFTYSIGILRLLIDTPQIERIYLVFDSSQKEKLAEFLNSKKVISVEFNALKFPKNVFLMFSYFLNNSYHLYTPLIKKYFPNFKHFNLVHKFAAFINPYRKLLQSLDIDIFHVPFQLSPIYSASKPIITTMHDVQEIYYPEFFTPYERMYRALNYNTAIMESDHIIVSFDHVKNDIVKYFKIEPGKVSVCTPPIFMDWFTSTNFTAKTELTAKYNLENNFILYPAATWQHKNHIAIIKAVKELEQKGKTIQVIFTGNKTDFHKNLIEEIEQLELKSEFKFLGIIPEEDLIGLYKSTKLVVIPTLYEAGSGILFESMKYGANAVCSNITSLPDSMENENYIFHPGDYSRIAELIELGVWDEDFRKANIEHLKNRFEYFKSLNYAEGIIETYKNTAAKFKMKRD